MGQELQQSHPDHDGALALEVFQDRSVLGAQLGSVGTFKATYALWRRYQSSVRGAVDLNFASQDGAVIRFNNVKVEDDRMSRVPVFGNGRRWNTWWQQVPW